MVTNQRILILIGILSRIKSSHTMFTHLSRTLFMSINNTLLVYQIIDTFQLFQSDLRRPLYGNVVNFNVFHAFSLTHSQETATFLL
ncbi:hypothetical protein JOD29_000778 [Lysinibacillus composti]|nr:hypothetical protein [Lysinibacillus composti]